MKKTKKFIFCNKYVKPKYLESFVAKIANELYDANKRNFHRKCTMELKNAVNEWHTGEYTDVYKTVDNWLNHILDNLYNCNLEIGPGRIKPEPLKHVRMTEKLTKLFNNCMKQRFDEHIQTKYGGVLLIVKKIKIYDRLNEIKKDFV